MLDELFEDGHAIDDALREAARDARRLHKVLGNPMATWKDGQIVARSSVKCSDSCRNATRRESSFAPTCRPTSINSPAVRDASTTRRPP